MDARKFYTIKRKMLIDMLSNIASAKERLSDLEDHEDDHAAAPDMSDIISLSAGLEVIGNEIVGLLDALDPLIFNPNHQSGANQN